MRLRTLIELAAALLLTFAALVAISQMARAQAIRVESAYARASIGGSGTGAVYLTLTNAGASADRLRAAATDVAERSELHLHSLQSDVMTMTRVDCLVIPAGVTIAMAPGGLHVMLSGLAAPLKAGDRFPLRLKFDNAGEVVVTVSVEKATVHHPGVPAGLLEFCH
jgi:periplasmic copper chaperone A